MRKLLIVLASVGFALAGLGLSPLPAQAETCLPGTSLCQGGRVDHVNDADYDPAIIIFCDYKDAFTNGVPDPNWFLEKYVPEGTSSTSKCGDDTDVIYLRAGEELWCQYPYGLWKKVMDATGPHKIEDLFDGDCTLRKD